MKINGLEIDARPEDIIGNLKMELERSGEFLFKKTKSLADNLQFTCPFHGNGQERKPSCGMSREVSYSGSKMYEPGMVHCFTCGYTAQLPKFVSDVFDKHDGGFFGNQWLKENFLSTEEVMRTPIILNFDRSKKATTIRRTEVEPISDDILDEYRWIHSYMYRRGLTDQLIAKFDIGYDEDSDCITFPVRNMQGETVFLQRRGVKAKFHKYEERAPKTEYLYGEYELSLYAADAMTVVVTESIINALSLWKHNIPAVALMGLGGGIQMDLLKNLKCRRIIIAMDPDEPGQEAANKILKALFNSKVAALIEYPSYMKEEELDLNDVIDDIPQIFTQLLTSLK